MANDTAEQRRWRAVLSDNESSEELRTEARQRLGLQPDPSSSIRYRAELDVLVESYWNRRKADLEERDPSAERVYLTLVRWAILGGNSQFAEADAATLLNDVMPACRSEWMRRRAYQRALLTIFKLDRASIPPELAAKMIAALASVEDF